MAGTSGRPDLPHHPVLYNEIITALRPRREGLYVDATVGAGGHAWGLLSASAPSGRLLGLDLDTQALALARQRLAPFSSRLVLVEASYTSLASELDHLGWSQVDGILLDLGLSSIQLESPERGFSFQVDGPLDMRFGPGVPQQAGDLVNHLSEAALADLLFQYGEERYARRIARAILQARPIYRTTELARVVTDAIPGGRRGGIHPATRTFQALRIAVNEELVSLEAVLPQAVGCLAPRGRLAVIAFHSLEDRLVKQFFQRESRDCICPPSQPVCTCGHRASIQVITRKPIRPEEAEVRDNPRARSARLRVAEKKVA